MLVFMQDFKVWASRVGPRGDVYTLLQVGDWADGDVWLAGEMHPSHQRLEKFLVKVRNRLVSRHVVLSGRVHPGAARLRNLDVQWGELVAML
jgi:hypothetical protein